MLLHCRGTNDLGSALPEKITENLIGLHAQCHSRGIHTIALGVSDMMCALRFWETAAARLLRHARITFARPACAPSISIVQTAEFPWANESNSFLLSCVYVVYVWMSAGSPEQRVLCAGAHQDGCKRCERVSAYVGGWQPRTCHLR